MTPTYPHAPTIVTSAYRWMHRGDQPMAETQVRKLSPDELRAAHTDLLRLAVLIETIRFEDLAKAILTSDALPEGVEGFEIHGRACVWCKALDCDQREVHAQLERVGQREAGPMDIYDLGLPTPAMAALFRKADEIEARYRRCWYCQQGDHGDCLGEPGCRCIDCFPDREA